MRDVEFVGAISNEESTSTQVGLSASVIFTYTPSEDDPIQLVRVLDGPVTLVRTAPATFRVVDLLRNGVPMSDGIVSFPNQRRTEADVTIRLTSLFMFPPYWQFNVIVENRGATDLELDPEGAALFVETADGFDRVDGSITGSLDLVPAGSAVDGLMVFRAQDTADGRVLSLVYGTRLGRAPVRVPADGSRHGGSPSPTGRGELGADRPELDLVHRQPGIDAQVRQAIRLGVALARDVFVRRRGRTPRRARGPHDAAAAGSGSSP